MSEDKVVLAIVTEDEIAIVKALSDKQDKIEGNILNMLDPTFDPMVDEAYVEASNAIFDWFELMAEKYGFSKDIQVHVNFEPRTICEGKAEAV